MNNLPRLLLPQSKEEWLNLAITFLGIGMIIVSVLADDTNSMAKSKFYAIIENLGIGIFPTGIVGFILERMQIREKKDKKIRIRTAILQGLNVSIHSYLNVLCNSMINKYPDLKGKEIFDIIEAIKAGNRTLEYTEKEKDSLHQLTLKAKTSFEYPDPSYLIADIFSKSEEDHFLLLINKGTFK